MKNKLFLLIAASLLLVGCSSKKAEETPVEPNNGTNDPVLPEGVKTKTFTFVNNKEVFPTGNLTQAASLTKFVEGFNKDGEFVTSASLGTNTSVQMLSMNNEPCYIKSILQLGSQNKVGELTINFSVNLIDIKVEAQACWKSYAVNNVITTSVDTASHLYVDKDEQDIDLSAEANQEPAKHEATFQADGQSVKFYTKVENQRAYIHSLTITYRE